MHTLSLNPRIILGIPGLLLKLRNCLKLTQYHCMSALRGRYKLYQWHFFISGCLVHNHIVLHIPPTDE